MSPEEMCADATRLRRGDHWRAADDLAGHCATFVENGNLDLARVAAAARRLAIDAAKAERI